MKLSKKILIGAMLLVAAPSFAQFTLDGELRPRFEYRHGFKAVADSAQDGAASVEQRTRLNFGYKHEGYIFKVTLQDIRVWGSQPTLVGTAAQQNNDGAYLSVHEAWGEALLSDKWSVKMGRQEIDYDDARIFGNVAWAQQARSHDAAILKFKTEKFKMDLGGAYNQDVSALAKTDAFKGSYKAMQYLWLNNKFSESFSASVLFLNLGKQQLNYDSTVMTPPVAPVAYYTDNYSQTMGTRLLFKKAKLEVAGAFYYQMGLDGRSVVDIDRDGEYNKEVQAMNYRLDVSYKITEKLTASAGYEYMSGNSQTDTNLSYKRINHAFNPHFGTNHKFNGYMDYFYVGNHIGSVGLNDIFFGLKYKSEKFWVAADAHLFSAAADVRDGYKYQKQVADAVAAGLPTTDINQYPVMDANLGTEIDFTFGFNLSKGVDLQAGYSVMMDTETLAYLKGVTYKPNNLNAGQGRIDQMNSWGWVMVTFKPKFITGEEKK